MGVFCLFGDNQEPVKYTKRVTKVGDKVTFPKKGDDVACYYTGTLENGKVFDTNTTDGMSNISILNILNRVNTFLCPIQGVYYFLI